MLPITYNHLRIKFPYYCNKISSYLFMAVSTDDRHVFQIASIISFIITIFILFHFTLFYYSFQRAYPIFFSFLLLLKFFRDNTVSFFFNAIVVSLRRCLFSARIPSLITSCSFYSSNYFFDIIFKLLR